MPILVKVKAELDIYLPESGPYSANGDYSPENLENIVADFVGEGLHVAKITEVTCFEGISKRPVAIIELARDERRAAIIELARDEHQDDGVCEIDDNAKLSEGEDNGTYVQAWVWVSFAGTQFDKEK